GMTEVDRKKCAAWNGIARIRVNVQQPHCRACPRRVRQTDSIDLVHDTARAQQGVVATGHGCGTRMSLLSPQIYFIPSLTLGAGHHADALSLSLENRSLFDVQCEECRDLAPAHRLFTAVTNAPQLLTRGFAIEIRAGHG